MSISFVDRFFGAEGIVKSPTTAMYVFRLVDIPMSGSLVKLHHIHRWFVG